jgi:hypothetical protein
MTEEGIGAVNPNLSRTWIPIHQAQAHVSRFARRKRRSANTATTARTTQIFIASLSRGRPEPVRLRVYPARLQVHLAQPEQPELLPGRKRRPERAPRPGACSSDEPSGA